MRFVRVQARLQDSRIRISGSRRTGTTFWRFILTKDFLKRAFRRQRNGFPPVRRRKKRTQAGARLPCREMEKRSKRKKSPSRRSSRLRRFSWYITFKKDRKRACGKFSLAGTNTRDRE